MQTGGFYSLPCIYLYFSFAPGIVPRSHFFLINRIESSVLVEYEFRLALLGDQCDNKTGVMDVDNFCLCRIVLREVIAC